MNFPTIQYLDWFKTMSPVDYDLRRSGVPHLSISETDLKIESLELFGPNFYGYMPLVEALGERYGVSTGNIVSTLGTTQSLYLISAAVLEKGDEVVVECPAYEPLAAVPAVFGAQVLRFSRDYDRKFQIRMEELEKQLSPRTKMVLISNLHNPSGIYTSEKQLRQLADYLQKKQILLVIDEVYREAAEGQERTTSHHLAENVVTMSSMNKVFGLSCLRCGWLFAPMNLVHRIYRIVDYINGENVFLGEQVSAYLAGRLDTIKRSHRDRILQNFARIKNWIEEEEGLSWVEPDAGMICFPRLEVDVDGSRFVDILREEFQTAVVPGRFFDYPKHFRLGFGGDRDTLDHGISNIQKLLARYQ